MSLAVIVGIPIRLVFSRTAMLTHVRSMNLIVFDFDESKKVDTRYMFIIRVSEIRHFLVI